MIKIILLNTVAIPVVAYLDYLFLRKHVEDVTGKPAQKWYWLWPCILELMIFNIGIIVGMSGAL